MMAVLSSRALAEQTDNMSTLTLNPVSSVTSAQRDSLHHMHSAAGQLDVGHAPSSLRAQTSQSSKEDVQRVLRVLESRLSDGNWRITPLLQFAANLTMMVSTVPSTSVPFCHLGPARSECADTATLHGFLVFLFWFPVLFSPSLHFCLSCSRLQY